MKNKYLFILLISTFILILGACSDDKSTDASETDSGITNNEDQEDESEEDEDTSNSEDENGSNANDLGIEEGDQLDLGIGDTGKIDSINGVFELTLDAAKIIKDELDGEESQLDDIILLDLTLKNTSDEILDVEDIMGNFEVTYTLDGTGTPDGAEYFDSVDKLTGELAPGEELKGQFVTYIYDKDEYYFRQRSGFSDSGKSNTVIFTFKADEAK